MTEKEGAFAEMTFVPMLKASSVIDNGYFTKGTNGMKAARTCTAEVALTRRKTELKYNRSWRNCIYYRYDFILKF